MDDAQTDRAKRPGGTQSIEAIQDDFRGRNYIADRSLATAVFLGYPTTGNDINIVPPVGTPVVLISTEIT